MPAGATLLPPACSIAVLAGRCCHRPVKHSPGLAAAPRWVHSAHDGTSRLCDLSLPLDSRSRQRPLPAWCAQGTQQRIPTREPRATDSSAASLPPPAPLRCSDDGRLPERDGGLRPRFLQVGRLRMDGRMLGRIGRETEIVCGGEGGGREELYRRNNAGGANTDQPRCHLVYCASAKSG